MKTLTFLLSTVIELYTMALLLRVWMQWARCDFYNPFSQFIVKITQPVVGPLRRVIPAMGPIDSSSLLMAFILSVIKAIVLFMVCVRFVACCLQWAESTSPRCFSFCCCTC